MPNYRYELRQNTGQVISGVITAESSKAAALLLRNQGGYVLKLNEAANAKGQGLRSLLNFNLETGPSQKDVLNFTRQLAVMMKSGISIRAGLEAITDQIVNKKFRGMLENVRRDVESGKPFSDALAKYPRTFSPLYINMVRASELSGSFGEMLERIAEYLGQQIETRSQVRGAMVYPIIIAVMAVSTTVFLLTFVLPKFVVIFQGKEAALPAPTKVILMLSYLMRTYWYIFLTGVVGAAWAFMWTINTRWGRAWWDQVKLCLLYTSPSPRDRTRSRMPSSA